MIKDSEWNPTKLGPHLHPYSFCPPFPLSHHQATHLPWAASPRSVMIVLVT